MTENLTSGINAVYVIIFYGCHDLDTPDLEESYVWLDFQNVQTIAYSFSVFHSKNSVALQKGKALPLQAWTGPEGSRRLRLPDSKTVGT